MLTITPIYSGEVSEGEKLLKGEKIGRLGMHGDQYPYVIPLCYTYHDGAIYFHARKKGQKLDYIRNNNRVCFQVDKVNTLRTASSPCDYSLKYTSVILFGLAEEVQDFNEKAEVLDLLTAAFSNGQPTTPIEKHEIDNVAVIKISVDNMMVKVNTD